MQHYVVNLSREYGLDGNAELYVYVHHTSKELGELTKNLDAVVVVPGGGYGMCSDREAEPIALDFLNRNYNAFVLYYDVAPYRYPLALTQLACAVDYVKTHAQELNVNPDRVFATGFSAGGHLTGCLANFWNRLPVPDANGKKIDAKVAGVALSYPVIDIHSHEGSFRNLLGIEDVECEQAYALSLERSVNADNPPCMIWTMAGDTCVNPMATVKYTAAYLEKKLNVESHIFPYGWHGGATCDGRTNKNFEGIAIATEWLDFADRFFRSL